MKVPPVSDLTALRPAIKSRWTELLQAKPAGPPAPAAFVHSDMLVFMLDGTLDRLADRLREAECTDRLMRDLAPFAPMSRGCLCGLHLLLEYYHAGAEAISETLPADSSRLQDEVIHHFNQIAHDEMDALCGICRYQGGSLCNLGNRPRRPVAIL